MGRSPCCDDSGLKKGPWTPEEDEKLTKYIQNHGHSSWRALPKLAGLNRCGKSCRLRWTNYLRPDIKRGKFSHEEEQTILNLHAVIGNKWSTIASHLPGRTDNEIKNFWNTHLKKKLIQMGFDPMTHRPRTDVFSSLSQLMSLANLKGLVDLQHQQYPVDKQAIQKLQAEMAKLEFLQYLLQPPLIMNSFNPSDLDTVINLLNLISSVKESPNIANLDPSLFSSYLQDFRNLPALKTLDSNPDSPPDLLQNNQFKLLGEQENLPISPTWFSDPSNSAQTQLPSLVPSAVTENLVANPYVVEDVCSTIAASASSSHEPAASASAAWPDLLLDDSLFPDIH